MKKSLIAAAVAAAIAAPSANAGVTFYGYIHNSIDYLNSNASGMSSVTGLPVKGWQVTSRYSALGWKGSEDLGNGLKAIWQVELDYDTANGGAWSGSSNNTFIGLDSDWGTLVVGNHDTPYKMAVGFSGIDMLGDTIADANTMFGFGDVRLANSITYVSPNFNGLSFAASVAPGEGAFATLVGLPHLNAPAFNGVVADTGIADVYSVAAMYTNNGLNLTIAYEDLGFGFQGPAITGWDDTKLFLGAAYSMNGLEISVAYQDQDLNARNVGNFDNINITSIAVAAAYSFGNNRVIGTFGQFDADETSNVPAGFTRNWKADSWALALEHTFSQRTKAYVVYASSELGIDGAASTFVSPAVSSSIPALNSPAAAGKAFSIGLIHTF